MSNYKRLTNNNSDGYDAEYDFCCGCQYFGEPCGCNRPNGTCDSYDRFLETYNRLSELEDKIEAGTLIEIPCKVGDNAVAIIDTLCYPNAIYNIDVNGIGMIGNFVPDYSVTNYGWICPKCGAVLSPSTQECPYCTPYKMTCGTINEFPIKPVPTTDVTSQPQVYKGK